VEKRAGARFSQRGLSVGGVEHDLFAGAIHYWRLDRADWRPCLLAMKKLGLSIVETYVPWAVHELARGSYEWKRELDVGAFLDEVARQDMLAIVRPGPHINAELTLFGFPERVLRDERNLAKTARGTKVWLPAPPRMFPVPSYASTRFRKEVAGWFDVMAEHIAPRLAPSGPVVAVGVDNESQMFFRLGAYDHDYHDDSLAWWHEYAGDVEPPREWSADDAERCVRWVEFKEEYTARSLNWVADELERVGLGGVATFHNLPPSEPSLVMQAPNSERMLIGSDFYHQAKEYASYRRRARYLVGSARPLPFAPEVGAGGPPWLPPMSDDDQKNVMLALLASGVRGFNLYMTVDRDRWYAAPVSATGELRGTASWFTTLLATLRDVKWTTLRDHKPLALISTRCDARYAIASSIADPVTPVLGEFLGLGPAGAAELSRDDAAREHRLWLHGLEQALALAQIPYDIVDERCCSAEQLAGYGVVVLPTLSRVDRELWVALHQAADAGVRVVVGPERPSQDQYGKPLADPSMPAKAGVMRPDSLDDLDEFASDLSAVVGPLPDEWATANEVPVDCSSFADTSGEARVVFAANRSAEFVTAEIVAVDGTRLRDPFNGRELACEDGVIAVGLQAFQVRLFVVA